MNRKNKISAILVAILASVFLATAVIAAENIYYTYTMASTSELLNSSSTGGLEEVNVTLPNTTFNLELKNDDGRFKIFVQNLNTTDHGALNISAQVVNLGAQPYSGDFSNVAGTKYQVYYAYAFNVTQLVDTPYLLTLNYSGLSSMDNPRFFKCEYDFTTDQTDFSSCADLGSASDTVNKLKTATLTSFSSFLLADDNAPPSNNVAQGGAGGGGGGGGSTGPSRLIYVTPTPEGQTVQVHNGDELVILFNDKEYHFAVEKTSSQEVTLKAAHDWFAHRIQIGDEKRMGLESFMSDDIRVAMSIVNSFAMLTFRTVEKKPFVFPLLPARQRQVETPVVQPPAVVTQVPPVQPGQVPAQPSVEAPVEKSPFNIGLLIGALVFAALLVGGVVMYRSRTHVESPPAVKESVPEVVAGTVADSKTSVVRPVKPIVAPPMAKPVVPDVPKAKLLEAEKFIYHAYSLGYRPEQVKQKLMQNGWPEDVVDYALATTKVAK